VVFEGGILDARVKTKIKAAFEELDSIMRNGEIWFLEIYDFNWGNFML
jgi:hypothetical protein